MRSTLSLVFVVVVLSNIATAADIVVAISSPKDGSIVGQRPIIAGTVSDPRASVWLVVHPLEVSNYWVQPRITIRKDGTWKVQAYIGRPGADDVGWLFEVRAVANPHVKLREGEVLDSWPKAAAISNLIEVTRK